MSAISVHHLDICFIVRSVKISSIVKDNSATSKSLLTDNHICEIKGQNVSGLKDAQTADRLSKAGTVVTLTIMPAFIWEHY